MRQFGSRRWLALAALALSGLCIGVDTTVLSLALPTLSTSLHASTAELQWFVAAYSLVLAAAMIPGGMLGDRYGRKKMLLIALAIFGVSSLACAYAPSSAALIGARAALGLAAAVITPLTLSVLPVLFSEQERGRAVAIVVGMGFVALPLGPLLGGWMLTRFWWGSVFLINVPVVVFAMVAVAALLPESRSEHVYRLDPIGILLSSAGLALITYGVIEAGEHGWGDGAAVALMLAGVAALVAFVLWERRVRQPLVDLSLFRSPGFTWGAILLTMVNFAMMGLLFAVPQYFQAILRTDAFGSGLRLLPLIAGVAVGGMSADRLGARLGGKKIVGAGFACLAAGLLLGATMRVTGGELFVAVWISVTGVGFGLALPKTMDTALGALSAERSGVGSALLQALRMVGASFGAAILGSILSTAYQARLDLGELPGPLAAVVRDGVFGGLAVAHKLGSPELSASIRAAFVHGIDVMLLVSGALMLVAVLVAVVFLPGGAASVERADVQGIESECEPTA